MNTDIVYRTALVHQQYTSADSLESAIRDMHAGVHALAEEYGVDLSEDTDYSGPMCQHGAISGEHCSACGDIPYADDMPAWISTEYRTCPECGASEDSTHSDNCRHNGAVAR